MNLILIEEKGICVGVFVCGEKIKKVLLGEGKEDVICEGRVSFGSKTPSSLFVKKIKEDFTAYLKGRKVNFSSYKLEMNLSSFACKVLSEVRKIPYGKVRSYRQIAEKVGFRGFRAIGRILSKNPFPIVIPCHRVICSDGGLGGFSSGVRLKKRLLELEGLQVDPLSLKVNMV